MKLKLTVNGKVFSSIPIDESIAENEACLKAYRRLLLMRHSKALRQQTAEPVFSLETAKLKEEKSITYL